MRVKRELLLPNTCNARLSTASCPLNVFHVQFKNSCAWILRLHPWLLRSRWVAYRSSCLSLRTIHGQVNELLTYDIFSPTILG